MRMDPWKKKTDCQAERQRETCRERKSTLMPEKSTAPCICWGKMTDTWGVAFVTQHCTHQTPAPQSPHSLFHENNIEYPHHSRPSFGQRTIHTPSNVKSIRSMSSTQKYYPRPVEVIGFMSPCQHPPLMTEEKKKQQLTVGETVVNICSPRFGWSPRLDG